MSAPEMHTPETHPHFREGIKSWPHRVQLMQTSWGMHIFHFEPSGTEEGERNDCREAHLNPLTEATELWFNSASWMNGQIVYYPPEIFEPLCRAQQRVIRCLQWKWRENFAQW